MVDGVIPQRADDLGARVVELDRLDVARRQGAHFVIADAAARDVPDVDAQARIVVPRLAHHLARRLQVADVGEGQYLDGDIGADLAGMLAHLGEGGGVARDVDGLLVHFRRDLEVTRAERGRRLQQVAPHGIGGRLLRPLLEPVAEELDLDMRDAVVVEDLPHAAEPHLRGVGHYVVVDKTHAGVAGGGGGLGALAKRERTDLARPHGIAVAGYGPVTC